LEAKYEQETKTRIELQAKYEQETKTRIELQAKYEQETKTRIELQAKCEQMKSRTELSEPDERFENEIMAKNSMIADLKNQVESLEIQLEMLRNTARPLQDPPKHTDVTLEKERYKDLAIHYEKLASEFEKFKNEQAVKDSSHQDQTNDFKLQVATRQSEIASLKTCLQESIDKSAMVEKECEEKVKKLKGLLFAANKKMTQAKKSINESNDMVALITEKEDEIKVCKSRIEELEKVAVEKDDHIQNLQNASLEMQQKITNLSITVEQNEANHQEYKQRAHALLQSNGSEIYTQKLEELKEAMLLQEREIQYTILTQKTSGAK
jgi:hypothetical protein